MNVLVTGGAGFIGSHLLERLLSEGHRVICLDNFDAFYDPALKRRNLSQAIKNSTFRLVEGDLRDNGLIRKIFQEEKIDRVAHLAARAGVRPSVLEPDLYADVNIRGTIHLLEACERQSVRRFVFASSSSVYGNNHKVPFSEEDPVNDPISPYAATKRAGELLCYTYHHLYGMWTSPASVILRCMGRGNARRWPSIISPVPSMREKRSPFSETEIHSGITLILTMQ